ncbi:phosphotransferase [Thalassotalea sp. LPB0316]|uniref:aminoglycoside phosphotransferase family protein n=1 Tax=Thalassotalea sp. LPB0316 TaxID=2769490 RepID=UPI001865E1B1|nr:phosphotransferase [Thalassotalea sp. LPB0316]QOL26645.1 phosphotransferase [Thalassotalea sp. LPB0316]
MATQRSVLLKRWLISQLEKLSVQPISPNGILMTALTGDAGFRQYFRVQGGQNRTFILVDAPPKLSNNQGFVDVTGLLTQHNVNVPNVLSFDAPNGFLLLEDLGDQQFFDVLAQDNLLNWYHQAIDQLIKITAIDPQALPVTLPDYDDAFVLTELTIFSQWLIDAYLDIHLTSEQQQQLTACFDVLIANVNQQPKVVMHRDFHSRNLMVCDNQIAVIDYQDAVVGALTYDIVSLLRDCYKKLSPLHVSQLFEYFIEQASSHPNLAAKLEGVEPQQLKRWFDLMGLQRHIKASGIFARLSLRDNKHGYLNDIPLTLEYIVEVSAHYCELVWLGDFVEQYVQPALQEKLR